MERILEPEVMDIPQRARAYGAADFSEVNQAFVARLCGLTDRLDAATVLDLGCGPADALIRLAKARPKWRIAGLDASPVMLDLASGEAWKPGTDKSVALVLGNAIRSPFADASFDVVCSNSLLHHLPQAALLWPEIRRVAKAGTLVFLRDLSRPGTKKNAHAIVREYAGEESPLLQEDFYNSLLAAFTVGEVRTQLKEAGLRGFDVLKTSDRHLDVVGWLD